MLEETKVELNVVIKALLYLLFYLGIDLFVKNPDKWPATVCLTIFSFIALISMKCTSAGFCSGLNFYFFSFYSKQFPWEKYPHLKIDHIFGLTYCININYSDRCAILRCFFANFDEMAELISRNTFIAPKVRQEFVDYVKVRKKQSTKYRILHTVRSIAIIIASFAILNFLLDIIF